MFCIRVVIVLCLIIVIRSPIIRLGRIGHIMCEIRFVMCVKVCLVPIRSPTLNRVLELITIFTKLFMPLAVVESALAVFVLNALRELLSCW